MATPNADRLRGIEPWDPSTNDTTSGILDTIKTELDSVAALTESVATNLGSAIKGATADAVAASLDELGKKVRRHSEDIGVIVGARKEALEAGREAQNKNTEIQKELADAQAQYDSVIQKEPYLQAEMRAADARRRACQGGESGDHRADHSARADGGCDRAYSGFRRPGNRFVQWERPRPGPFWQPSVF